MKFYQTSVEGVLVIRPERKKDSRGFFSRLWCPDEFAREGLCAEWRQVDLSHNEKAGTLRGLHFQAAPHEEYKVISCMRGAAYDVVLDLRPESSTFRRWFATELTARNGLMVYIPPGCAHGYQTLTDETDMLYLISASYVPSAKRGVRWNDSAFGIRWPEADNRVMSEQDRSWADYREEQVHAVGKRLT